MSKAITFRARDGSSLEGQLFLPEADPKAAVLVTAGTGYKARYYHPFAEALRAAGLAVLTYDCRGIGRSAPDDLKSLHMRYIDWGRYDMPAALDALEESCPGVPLLHVGHSVGGHFVGFWDNHDKVAAHLFICVGSGEILARPWWKNPLELLFWNVIGPASIARHGYVRQGKLWTGASLPKGVFQDWKRWCHTKGYYAEELRGPLRPHFFDGVTAPITSMIYTDDIVATPSSGKYMLGFYPKAEHDLLVRAPSDYGLKAIGHGGPFSDKLAPARAELVDWCVAKAA
ncbi:alpha/beta fold hydrolase [Parvularcula sp. ZS-1/3]|uniref:Alpha/beta fold hydrolase n=1 Tax=Parvularcula mediterranea TaxID=2732508 RepID=A0A7Y3W4U9_9PROT|nr:alpha/beta fold hydrolase [Parvularcula mediterranea]NNU15576.1 alpha/beta fold hydrolase [Parvularcula mediterranea]